MASAICESANGAQPARPPRVKPSLRLVPGARPAATRAGARRPASVAALQRRPLLRGAAASALIAAAYVVAIVGARWLIAGAI